MSFAPPCIVILLTFICIPALYVVFLDIDGIRILSIPEWYVKHHIATGTYAVMVGLGVYLSNCKHIWNLRFKRMQDDDVFWPQNGYPLRACVHSKTTNNIYESSREIEKKSPSL